MIKEYGIKKETKVGKHNLTLMHSVIKKPDSLRSFGIEFIRSDSFMPDSRDTTSWFYTMSLDLWKYIFKISFRNNK